MIEMPAAEASWPTLKACASASSSRRLSTHMRGPAGHEV
jgi:hypothetical protein